MTFQRFHSIQLDFCNKKKISKVPYRGRNPEPEPPGQHRGEEHVALNRKNPGAGAGSILQKAGRVKEEREKRGEEREAGRSGHNRPAERYRERKKTARKRGNTGNPGEDEERVTVVLGVGGAMMETAHREVYKNDWTSEKLKPERRDLVCCFLSDVWPQKTRPEAAMDGCSPP